MFARTTISLEQSDLQMLQNLIFKENEKSLSSFIGKLIKEYLQRKEKELLMKKMEENYKKYTSNLDQKAFYEIEEITLEDL